MSRGTTHRADRGLAAVARVREIREQDSRIGLRIARTDADSAQQEAGRLGSQLAHAALPEATSPGLLLAHTTALAVLGSAGREARTVAATAERIAADAHAHWSSDRARMAAVEHVLAARAARRRAEATRRENAETDDLAAQLWLRRRTWSRDARFPSSSTTGGNE